MNFYCHYIYLILDNDIWCNVTRQIPVMQQINHVDSITAVMSLHAALQNQGRETVRFRMHYIIQTWLVVVVMVWMRQFEVGNYLLMDVLLDGECAVMQQHSRQSIRSLQWTDCSILQWQPLEIWKWNNLVTVWAMLDGWAAALNHCILSISILSILSSPMHEVWDVKPKLLHLTKIKTFLITK